MKILYAVSDRPGAIQQAQIIKQQLQNKCEIKWAGYVNLVPHLKPSWNLSALTYRQNDKLNSLYNKKYGFRVPVSNEYFEYLINTIEEYNPDLIISDNEQYCIAVGKILGIETWDLSPVNLYWNSQHRKWDYMYDHILYYYKRHYLENVQADRNLVYSPFYVFNLPLLDRQEWVKPFTSDLFVTEQAEAQIYRRPILESYLKLANINMTQSIGNVNFSSGETSSLTSVLQLQKPVHLMPNLADIETLVHAVMFWTLGIGLELGQIEKMEHHSIDRLEQAKHIKIEYEITNNNPENLLDLLGLS